MTDRGVAASLFVTLFVGYAYFFGGSGFNQNATFALTRSLVERHRIDIDAYAGNTADVSLHGGHLYSNKLPGLSFLAAVPYALIYAAAGPPRTWLELTLALYGCTVLVCGAAGAAIGVLLFRMLRRRGAGAMSAAIAAFVAAFGTPLFAYSTMLFAHVPHALFVLLALDCVERERYVAAGAALGAAVLTFYFGIPVAIVFVAVLLVQRRWRGAARMTLGALPFAIVIGVYQLAAFGSPFRTSIDTVSPAFRVRGALFGVLPGPSAEALIGITVSPFRGLFFIAPVLLLAIPGLVLMFRAGRRATALLIAAATVALIALNASFNGWHGGYTIGPRYLLGVVPLLMLAAHEAATRVRLIFAVLAAVSIVFNFAAAAVDPQPPDTLHDPLRRYELPALLFGGAGPDDAEVPIWIRQLYTGHTSTNRVAADELMPFSRHPVGSPANEWASFNLGEIIFGPGSAASLLPFALLMAIGITVTLRLTR